MQPNTGGGTPQFGSHTVVVKLLPVAYSSHCLLGAVYENLLEASSFGAVVWDRERLYTRTRLPSLQAAERAGMEMLEYLCASMPAPTVPQGPLMMPAAAPVDTDAPLHGPADANATLYVSSGRQAAPPAWRGAGSAAAVRKAAEDSGDGSKRMRLSVRRPV